MRVVILGCGRVGAGVASALDAEGHEVAIVDRNSDQFRRLDPDFGGTAVVGTGIDQDVLRRAGIEQADIFIALTNGDNTNAMAGQIAKHIFGVPRSIVRIYDPVREETYHNLGLETYCPTTIGVSIVRGLIERPNRESTGQIPGGR
jgi:trk system potassium uptake protein TrkA